MRLNERGFVQETHAVCLDAWRKALPPDAVLADGRIYQSSFAELGAKQAISWVARLTACRSR